MNNSNRHVLFVSILCSFALLGACEPKSYAPPLTEDQKKWDQEVKEEIALAKSREVPTQYVDIGCTEHGEERDMGTIYSVAVETVWFGQISKDFVGGGGLRS